MIEFILVKTWNFLMIVVGRFKKIFGIKGEIKVESYFTNKNDIALHNSFLLEDKTKIELIFVQKKNVLICKIANIETPEGANNYVNKLLYIESKELPKLKCNEYYFSDLIGLKVKINNFAVGSIISVNNHGAGDYLEIKKENSKKDIFLVPYNTSHILKTNKEKKEVLLNPIYYNKNEI